MSDFVVLCDICGKIAKHNCKLCGKRVCDSHFDKKSGLCSGCRTGKRLG